MVPIYSISSFTSMVSSTAAQFVDPIRDVYEAFTIYTFFQLLINYLDGERALIIMTHGRAPIPHLWPMDRFLRKVDISDPHTFLGIKRGILQYAWLKPLLGIAAIVMKATGTYQEGYIGIRSGYFWSGIIYNISVTVSLYSLGLFWVCMHGDLVPFRPVPKFLCVKLIIFASYWQGFLLSLLVWVGAIPDDVQGYTRNNLAAAIQDALICVEMPIFAVAHWYAFSWHDFADNNILSARMPLGFALRDAFGIRDLIEDSKLTFKGDTYGYRAFDSGDKVMAHEDSKSRVKRLKEGMRYERGGKGKYWLPRPGEASATSPLLGERSSGPDALGTFEDWTIDADEDRLYDKARQLEYGDWNVCILMKRILSLLLTLSQYPVITTSEPFRERFHSTRHLYRNDSPTETGWPDSTRAGASVTPRNKGKGVQEPPVIAIKTKKKANKGAKRQGSGSKLSTGSSDANASASNSTPAAETQPTPPPVSVTQTEQSPDVDVEHEDEPASRPKFPDNNDEEFRNVWS